VSTSPATTLFSNLNLVTTAGTAAPASVVPYYRTLWTGAPYGFYGVTGATAQKGSDKLDGVFQRVVNPQNISGGIVVINKILCLAFLLTYNDPVGGNRPLLCIFFNKKWFFASQGSGLTFIAGASLSGVQSMFGTDGTKLYKLFNDNTANINQKVQSKLWDFGEATISDTQVLKVGIEATTNSTGTLNVTVDSETSQSAPVTFNSAGIVWINGFGNTITWTNYLSATIGWEYNSYGWYKSDISNYGKYAGLTVTTTIPGLSINAMQLQYELRARW
jgi:hypothetical protein